MTYPSLSSANVADEGLEDAIITNDISTALVLKDKEMSGTSNKQQVSTVDTSSLIGPPSASASSSRACIDKADVEVYDPEDYILAMFIVRFDTHRGNTVAWTYPESK
jgi:hypothetical protein